MFRVNGRRDLDKYEAELRAEIADDLVFRLSGVGEDGKKLSFNHTEIRCAQLLLQGFKAKDIAKKIKTTPYMANYHIRNLKEKAASMFVTSSFKDGKQVASFLAEIALLPKLAKV